MIHSQQPTTENNMTNIAKINAQAPGRFYQGVSFHFKGQIYSANIGMDGRKSSLYVFGQPGDDCIRTIPVQNAELLAEIERIVRSAE
jgi:hypothetical protein